MKSKLISIGVIAAVVILIFTGLSISSNTNKSNGFNRKLLRLKVEEVKTQETPSTYFYISGIDGDTIFFFSSNPNELLLSNFKLNSFRKLKIDIDTNQAFLKSAFKINVNFPIADVYAYNLSSIFRYNLITHGYSTLNVPKNYSRSENISEWSFILRTFDSTNNNQIFIKKNFTNSSIVKENNISDKLNDGGLATAGTILFDSIDNQILYVYTFKNKIISMDTNLNIKGTYNTIDTFSTYQLLGKRIERADKTHFFTLALPPLTINNICRISNGFLFVNSGVKANNEKNIDFKLNSVIDIYNLKSKKYLASFYLPKHKSERLLDFLILDKNVIATYKHAIVIYSISDTFETLNSN